MADPNNTPPEEEAPPIYNEDIHDALMKIQEKLGGSYRALDTLRTHGANYTVAGQLDLMDTVREISTLEPVPADLLTRWVGINRPPQV